MRYWKSALGILSLGCDDLHIAKIRVFSVGKYLLIPVFPQRGAEYIIARGVVR